MPDAREDDDSWAGAGQSRWPCLGLALAAIVGIAAGSAFESVAWPAWAALTLLAAVGWRATLPKRPVRGGTLWALASTACFFAAWYGLRVDASPARQLAAALDPALPAPIFATGVVADAPATTASGRTTLTMRIETLEAANIVCKAPARVLVAWVGSPPHYGDRLAITARIERIPQARNPGAFDPSTYYTGRGIFHQIILKHPWEGTIVEHGQGNPLVAACHSTRRWMLDALSRGIEDSPDVVGVIGGMVLGERGDQSPALRRMFRETGTLHLFAVSGLHVWMFGLLAWAVISTFCPVRRRALLILIPLLVFYAAVTGLRPSVVRATIMAIIVLGSLLVERPPAMPNNLAAAALTILGIDPAQLFDLGFQLSFCVVGAISVLASPIARRLGDWWVPDPFLPHKLLSPIERAWQFLGGKATAALAVTLSAWLGSLPLIYCHFHLVSPIALVANLAAVALGFAVLAIGMLSLALAPLTPVLATAANNANWLAASALLTVVKTAWLIPGGALYSPPPWEHSPPLQVTVFDFAEGGGIHLEAGSRHALIDTGSSENAQFTLTPYLRWRGATQIEEVVLSHGDSHHIGGAPFLIEEFRVHSLSQPMARDRSSSRRATLAAAREHGIPCHGRSPGEKMTPLPGVQLEFLDPPPGLEERRADDESLVVRVSADGWHVLVLGDAGFRSCQRLAAMPNPGGAQADIAVVGWNTFDAHGVADFLIESVRPRLVILGDNPFARDPEAYDHMVRDLRSHGIPVIDQRQSGAVILRIRADRAEAVEFLTGNLHSFEQPR